MVKQGKKQRKRGGDLQDLVIGGGTIASTAASSGDGWVTGTSAMLLDDSKQPQGTGTMQIAAVADEDMAGVQLGGAKAKKGNKRARRQSQAGSAAGMDTEDAPTQKKVQGCTSHVPGLGVVHHSMKRGDRTTAQKKRKAAKLVKAVARAEKTGVRIDTKASKKSLKTQLKHVYE